MFFVICLAPVMVSANRPVVGRRVVSSFLFR